MVPQMTLWMRMLSNIQVRNCAFFRLLGQVVTQALQNETLHFGCCQS